MGYQSTREKLTIRTAVKPELIRATLKRGGGIAAAGALMILLGGTLLPLPLLKIWGIPIFFGGLILIAIGWLPYRELQRLELKPNELAYDGTYFHFVKGGKPLFKIPEKSIAKLEYVEKDQLYGAAIRLKKPVEEKVVVLQRRFNFERFVSDSSSRFHGCDLFLPYFTESGIKLLLESDHAF
ncbi:MAG: hypothetical protein JJU12_03380 [Chlamydiales bacterium]|nr:hypothetical protein [Chlamydiales bacterium]